MSLSLISFNVEGMTCDHCVQSVKKGLFSLAGVSSVDVDLMNKTVTVGLDPNQISRERIEIEIKEIGYEVIQKN